MITQQLGFSILTAPVAAIDRRSLSQAWYSALHVAQKTRTPSCETAPKTAAQHHLQPIARRAPHGGESAARERSTVVRSEKNRETRGGVVVERRTPHSRLARRIERTFLHPRLRVHHATFAVEGTKARVHIALQSSGGATHLVAICPPQLRSRVARALEQARFALAARGIQLALDFSSVC